MSIDRPYDFGGSLPPYQDVPAPTEAERDELMEAVDVMIQSLILRRVLNQHRHWTVAGMVKEVCDDRLAVEAIDALQEAGLIQRAGERLYPTQAAIRFDQPRV